MTLYKWGKFKVQETYQRGEYVCRTFFYTSKDTPMHKYIPFKFDSKLDLDKFFYGGGPDGGFRPDLTLNVARPDGYVYIDWRETNGVSVEGNLYRAELIQSQGEKVGIVTSTQRQFYPTNGVKDGYYYVYEGIQNQDPMISGSDAFIGNKSTNFRIDYIVTDDDLNDIVKVEIQEDKGEPKVISEIKLGVKNYLDINVEGYELGDHTITIKATDSQGAIATRIYRWTKINNAPLISGSDKDLGEKNTAFTVTYQVSDADNDIVNVVEKINGKVIRNLNNASKNTDLYLNITQEQILEFEIGKTNTIEIEATDTKGGVSYRRYTFKKTNLPPIISGNDRDLGVIDKALSYSYSVTDTEDDDIFVDVIIDETYLQKDIKVEAGKTYKVEIKGLDFLKLKPGKHTLKIMATDKKSDKVVKLINFTRDPKRLVVISAKPIETDAAAKKFYFNPVWKVAVGAEGKIEICNNGFDTNPTWEDATSTVKVGKTFNFTNQTKKASKWGIAVKMTINKNNATAISYIATAGGAFE